MRTIPIAVDGEPVELDLSWADLDKLMAALEPYLNAGCKVGGGSVSSRRRRTPGAGRTCQEQRAQAIREWAQANALQVDARGQIKKHSSAGAGPRLAAPLHWLPVWTAGVLAGESQFGDGRRCGVGGRQFRTLAPQS